MKLLIDSTTAARSLPLFGLAPLERLRRTASRLPKPPAGVMEDGDASRPLGTRLREALGAGETLLVLDGSSVIDPRLMGHLLAQDQPGVVVGGEGPERAAALCLRPDHAAAVPPDAASVLEVADALLAAGALPRLEMAGMGLFVKNLRREVQPWLFAVPDEASRRARERWMFWQNYKGSTDALTRWVYPPVVWPLVRLSARFRVHPNWITLMSVVLAFACVPYFAAGEFLVGFLMAYAMTILDSVDGKVARLTLTDSAIGNVMDHGLDIVHPPLWYLAWAWGLGARTLDDPAMLAALWLLGFYVADRIVLGIAKARFRRGLHAMTALDGAVRTWIARRNINMVILSVALLVGEGTAGMVACAAWQGLTLAWHTARTAQLWGRAPAAA